MARGITTIDPSLDLSLQFLKECIQLSATLERATEFRTLAVKVALSNEFHSQLNSDQQQLLFVSFIISLDLWQMIVRNLRGDQDAEIRRTYFQCLAGSLCFLYDRQCNYVRLRVSSFALDRLGLRSSL